MPDGSDAFCHEGGDLIQRNAFLLLGVPVADRDGLVAGRIAVDGEAEWATRFVHASVAFADALFDVSYDVPAFTQFSPKPMRDFGHAVFANMGSEHRSGRCTFIS